jgi:multisubunit Na+/H+ antiporter MnhE subunit
MGDFLIAVFASGVVTYLLINEESPAWRRMFAFVTGFAVTLVAAVVLNSFYIHRLGFERFVFAIFFSLAGAVAGSLGAIVALRRNRQKPLPPNYLRAR